MLIGILVQKKIENVKEKRSVGQTTSGDRAFSRLKTQGNLCVFGSMAPALNEGMPSGAAIQDHLY